LVIVQDIIDQGSLAAIVHPVGKVSTADRNRLVRMIARFP
jgi:hypothetical protein